MNWGLTLAHQLQEIINTSRGFFRLTQIENNRRLLASTTEAKLVQQKNGRRSNQCTCEPKGLCTRVNTSFTGPGPMRSDIRHGFPGLTGSRSGSWLLLGALICLTTVRGQLAKLSALEHTTWNRTVSYKFRYDQYGRPG